MHTLSNERLLKFASIAIAIVTVQMAAGLLEVAGFFAVAAGVAAVFFAVGMVLAMLVWNDLGLKSAVVYLVFTGTLLALAYYHTQLSALFRGEFLEAVGLPLDRVHYLFANIAGIYFIGLVFFRRRKARANADTPLDPKS